MKQKEENSKRSKYALFDMPKMLFAHAQTKSAILKHDQEPKLQRKVLDKSFKEIFSFQMLSLIGDLIAGSLLAWKIEALYLIPGLFVLLPGLMEMRGGISGPLASRLSSGLFLKVITPKHPSARILRGNILASFILTLLASALLGVIALALTYILTNKLALVLIPIAVIAALLANIVEIPLTIAITLSLFRHGHDPNNIMGTIITTVGDILGTLTLIITTALLI